MYSKTVFPNELRVVSHDMKERDSVSIGFWVGAGGRYEDDRLKGAAHFLEHILFKGSTKYSCEEIKGQMEGVGGSLNAFTAEEQTCYYAKIPAKHVNKTFAILADMVFAPLIQRKEVEKEKGVIIEEIKMYHDLPQYFVLELLDGMMWPDHPLGKSLPGTPESVGAMTNKDLKDFHQRHYSPNNVVIAACGNIKHQALVNLAKNKLNKNSQKEIIEFIKVDHVQSSSKVNFFRKNIEQMHLALGMRGLDDGHKDKYILSILNIILGGNMSSRLFDEVREKRGWAYSIGSGVKSLRDTGMFLVRAGVDNNRIVETVDLIIKELKKIKRRGISPGEFIRAKDYCLGQVLLGLEDTMEHMLWIGDSVLTHDKMRTLSEVVKRVKKIKIADVERVANDILQEQRYNLAIVGPITDKQEKSLGRIIGIS